MSGEELCRRCKKEKSVVVTRKEPFCKACFVRFLNGKHRRALDNYKVDWKSPEGTQPNVLLPLSLGRSSVALLDMTVELLREQKKCNRGRVGFNLIAVVIDESDAFKKTTSQDTLKKCHTLRRKYGDLCRFVYINMKDYVTKQEKFEIIINENHNPLYTRHASQDAQNIQFDTLLQQLGSKTSIEDAISSFRRAMILNASKTHNCTSVIWGHSMTKLAELVLSLTTKGRGNIISRELSEYSNQVEPITQLFQIHPLRDILVSEIDQYVGLNSLEDLTLEFNALDPKSSSRKLTIDELTKQYFRSISEAFPSIVSTVVRTADKLSDTQDGITSDMSKETIKSNLCSFCQLPITSDPAEWLTKISVHQPAPLTTPEERQLQQEALTELQTTRQTADIKPTADEAMEPLKLCYGCTISLDRAKEYSLTLPDISRASKAEIFEEYIIDSESEPEEEEGEEEGA